MIVSLLALLVITEAYFLFIAPTRSDRVCDESINEEIDTTLETTDLQNEEVINNTSLKAKPLPPGIIIFVSEVENPEYTSGYHVMNGDGNHITSLGIFTGATAWSPDGKKLAVGCDKINEICIVDMTGIDDVRTFPLRYEMPYKIIKKIELPQECVENLMPDHGIQSISWSRDGNNLAVVCKINLYDENEGKVCILSLSGDQQCWPDELGADVHKLVYSPVEDMFVASVNNTIVTLDINGEVIKELSFGINPAWSPDGAQIAFSTYIDEGPRNGIALINKDGTNFRWLYHQPDSGEWEEFINLIGQNCNGRNGGRISWSPDGKYIAFSGNYLGMYTNYIFRLDVTTGEVIILASNDNYKYLGDPNWGPLEIH